MLLSHVQVAPEGCTFALTAFDESLGKQWPVKIRGEHVGSATLIGAIPETGRRTVTLTWDVDELVAPVFAQFSERGNPLPIDDFVPELAYDPAAAIEKVRRATVGRTVDSSKHHTVEDTAKWNAIWGEGGWVRHKDCPTALEAGQTHATHSIHYHDPDWHPWRGDV